MSKYCDYEKDDFYSCLSKDKELCDNFLNALSPSYKSNLKKLNDKENLLKDIKSALDSNIDKFKIRVGAMITTEEVFQISNENNLYCNYDIHNNEYYFIIKG